MSRVWWRRTYLRPQQPWREKNRSFTKLFKANAKHLQKNSAHWTAWKQLTASYSMESTASCSVCDNNPCSCIHNVTVDDHDKIPAHEEADGQEPESVLPTFGSSIRQKIKAMKVPHTLFVAPHGCSVVSTAYCTQVFLVSRRSKIFSGTIERATLGETSRGPGRIHPVWSVGEKTRRGIRKTRAGIIILACVLCVVCLVSCVVCFFVWLYVLVCCWTNENTHFPGRHRYYASVGH